MIYNAMVTSLWDDGLVETECKFNDETGEIFDIEKDWSNEDRGSLIQEYIEFDNGQSIEEHDICMICHSHILVNVMKDDGLKNCTEEWKCMNPDCESNQLDDFQESGDDED